MNFNIGLERKREQAMWYVSWLEKPKTSSDEAGGRKAETIAHGNWKGDRLAFLKITGISCLVEVSRRFYFAIGPVIFIHHAEHTCHQACQQKAVHFASIVEI